MVLHYEKVCVSTGVLCAVISTMSGTVVILVVFRFEVLISEVQ